MNEEVFELSAHDRQSALWVKLLAHFREKLRIARSKNDGDLSDTDTARMRGQIAVWKALITLDKDLPVVET